MPEHKSFSPEELAGGLENWLFKIKSWGASNEKISAKK